MRLDDSHQITCPACNGKHQRHTRDQYCKLGPNMVPENVLITGFGKESRRLRSKQSVGPELFAVAAAVEHNDMDVADSDLPEYRDILKESGMQPVTGPETGAR